MALYAFDGTWNEDQPDPEDDTNVVKFKACYLEKAEYIGGVGTRLGTLGRIAGGLFGIGGQTRIEEMYDKLVANWQAGDRAIDIVGFSRGAALAVHFSNVVTDQGIRVDGQTTVPPIRFLGLWDTVGSFGIPIDLVLNFQDIDIGYDLDVGENVQRCSHAMALHERRQTFDLRRQDVGGGRPNIEEVWFRGVHSDVGGGNANEALSSIALAWMLRQADQAGVPVDATKIAAIEAVGDPMVAISENLDFIRNPDRTIHPEDNIHPSAIGATLVPGEARSFKVRAAELYSWSGVRLEKGARYVFQIADGERWRDGDIECGPGGWETEDLPWYKEEFVALFESRRRCPPANWFELIGAVGDDEDHLFRIGKGGEGAAIEAPESGELYAFANDLGSRYENNTGEIEVTVACLAGAAG
ncbi:MAG: DUF2235 domain-containing protein [Alphaproteobacteria bacterium]|jgi:hypothetical protein|nr:DUF2235 domain-containing protein [Alphaproteobacteria bacterium]